MSAMANANEPRTGYFCSRHVLWTPSGGCLDCAAQQGLQAEQSAPPVESSNAPASAELSSVALTEGDARGRLARSHLWAMPGFCVICKMRKASFDGMPVPCMARTR